MIQVVHPGDLFGYFCFCNHRSEPLGTEARATTASTVLRTDYEKFRAALNRTPAIGVHLTEALCLRIAEAERRIRIPAIHDAKKRLATLLYQLAMAKQMAAPAPQGLVPIHRSHAELAAQCSLTRPHTTVLMTRFRELGCITYGRGTAIKVHMEHLASLIL